MLLKIFDVFILLIFAFSMFTFPVTCGMILSKFGLSDGVTLFITMIAFFSEVIVMGRVINKYSKYMLYGSQ